MSPLTQEQIDGVLADRDGRFSEWANMLVDHSRGGQRALPQPSSEILEWTNACRGGKDTLSEYLTKALGLSRAQVTYIADWPGAGPLTLNEFANPPKEREKLIAERLASVTSSQAAQPLFWVMMSLSGFVKGDLGDQHAHWLAEKEDWRKATRDALRRLGGAALEARGRLGVLVDHGVSRAWWRVRLAESVASYSELTIDEAHDELRTNTWAELAEATASRYTVVCDSRLRAEVVMSCASNPDATQQSKRLEIEALARQSLAYCSPMSNRSTDP